MKIGLFGGMANNLYAMASSLYRQGVEVEILRDEFERYPTSQPWWEDCEVVLPFGKMQASLTREILRGYETELDWHPPPYFVDSDSNGLETPRSFRERTVSGYKSLLLTGAYPYEVRRFLSSVDVAVVCGMAGEILASRSKTPFVIIPHGADIRLASQLDKFSGISRRSLGLAVRHVQLKNAFSKSGAVFGSSPSTFGGHLGHVNVRTTYGPMPMPDRRRSAGNYDKHDELQRLLMSLGVSIPRADRYFLVASRIDYLQKGSDILIEGISVANMPHFHFIFTGWGSDMLDARGRLRDSNCTFLPFAVSKPLLGKIIHLVDVVVDQFRMGSFGTASLEALSVGSPVMLNLDEENYRTDEHGPPPVINVATPAGVSDALRKIDSGLLNLADLSRKGSEWFARTHSESVAVPRFLRTLETLKGTGRF